MNQKELKELIEFLIEKDIAEFELERGDVKVKIKRAAEPAPLALPDSRYFAVHPAPSPVSAPPPASGRVDLAANAAARLSLRKSCTLCARRSWAPFTNRRRPGLRPSLKSAIPWKWARFCALWKR
jgi:biotin carboxyl carrier protein